MGHHHIARRIAHIHRALGRAAQFANGAQQPVGVRLARNFGAFAMHRVERAGQIARDDFARCRVELVGKRTQMSTARFSASSASGMPS